MRHMASSVLIRNARTFPVLSSDILDKVMPTLSDNSLSVILRFASITSRLITIIPYTVKSCSSFIVRANEKISASIMIKSATIKYPQSIVYIENECAK